MDRDLRDVVFSRPETVERFADEASPVTRLKEAWVWTKAAAIALAYGAVILVFAVYLGITLAVGAAIRSLRVPEAREEVFGDMLEDDG